MSKCPKYLLCVQLSPNKGCDQKINLGGRNKAGFIASPNISLWTLFKVSHLENCGPPLLSQCTHILLFSLFGQTQNLSPVETYCSVSNRMRTKRDNFAKLNSWFYLIRVVQRVGGIGGLALRCASCKNQVGASLAIHYPGGGPKKPAMPNMPPNKRAAMPATRRDPQTPEGGPWACSPLHIKLTNLLLQPPSGRSKRLRCVFWCAIQIHTITHCKLQKWMVWYWSYYGKDHKIIDTINSFVIFAMIN